MKNLNAVETIVYNFIENCISQLKAELKPELAACADLPFKEKCRILRRTNPSGGLYLTESIFGQCEVSEGYWITLYRVEKGANCDYKTMIFRCPWENLVNVVVLKPNSDFKMNNEIGHVTDYHLTRVQRVIKVIQESTNDYFELLDKSVVKQPEAPVEDFVL